MRTPGDGVLSFAVLGHPNEGKSSVVSTLTERDNVPISTTPGETEYNTEYIIEIDQVPILRFIDTPGFQVPRKTLKWLRSRSFGETAAETAAAYAKTYAGRRAFVHDERILNAVGGADGLLYVIDAAKPLGPDDLAEMEILRLLGKARMAVINSKGEDLAYIEKWRGELNRHFNSVRRFDAKRATFDERINLLRTLGISYQSWEKKLYGVIGILKRDWAARLRRTAEIVCELLKNCYTKQIRIPIETEEDLPPREGARKWPRGTKRADTAVSENGRGETHYKEWLRRAERDALKEIRDIFRHRQLKLTLDESELGIGDLFSKETWKVLGLSRIQLGMAAALAGALGGAFLDLTIGEVSLGAFMVGGALLGGIGGLAGGRSLSRVKIRALGRRLGRSFIEIGPPKTVQLAFVLIDRSLLYVDILSHLAHARRESVDIVAAAGRLRVTREWDASARNLVSRFVSKLTKDKAHLAEQEALRKVLFDIFSFGKRKEANQL